MHKRVLYLLCFVLSVIGGFSNNSWSLIRNDKPFGLESHLEVHDGEIINIGVSSSHEYFVTCSNDSTINFYRVLMYPNIYPHWTHLYYGKLTLENQLISCTLTKDQTHLIALTSGEQGLKMELFKWRKFEGVDNRGRVFGNMLPSALSLEVVTSFHIVHARDEYNEIWTNSEREGLFKISGKFQFETFSPLKISEAKSVMLKVSPNSQYVAISTDTKITIYGRGDISSKSFTHSKPVQKMEFSRDSQLLYTITFDGLNVWKLQPEGDWASIPTLGVEGQLDEIVVSQGPSCSAVRAGTYTSHLVALSNPHSIRLFVPQIVDGTVQFHLLQEIRGSFEKPLISFSPDDEILALGNQGNKTIQLWRKCNRNYCFHTTVFSPKEPSHLEMFNLKYYYLLIGANKHLLIFKSDEAMVPECDPKYRAPAFDLPAPPQFTSSEDRSNWIVERDGIFGTPTFYGIILVFLVLYIGSDWVKNLERFCLDKLNMDQAKWRKREDFIFFVGSTGIFLFSVYEILYQPDFMNDWPAHLHHVEQFWLEGTLDYGQHMHAHGPCTYPGGFMWLYTPLYILTGGSLQLFQLIWAAFEIVMFFIVWEIVQSLRLPRILGLLPVFSNRLHLYNVRVIINDFPSVLLMYVCIYLVIKKRFTLASILYSFVLSTKLNFVFYGPALALTYLKQIGFWPTFYQGIIMGIVQITIGIPFLATNWKSYLTISYDLGRTLLWEKTRNFKFVGRIMYDAKWFHLTLLVIIVLLTITFLWKVFKTKTNYEKVTGHALFFVNFIFVGLARGLYTPFMCWYFYSFPIVAYCSGIPLLYVTVFWVLHEYLFRFFRDMEFEMYATFVWLLINVLIIVKTMENYSLVFTPEKQKKKKS